MSLEQKRRQVQQVQQPQAQRLWDQILESNASSQALPDSCLVVVGDSLSGKSELVRRFVGPRRRLGPPGHPSRGRDGVLGYSSLTVPSPEVFDTVLLGLDGDSGGGGPVSSFEATDATLNIFEVSDWRLGALCKSAITAEALRRGNVAAVIAVDMSRPWRASVLLRRRSRLHGTPISTIYHTH